MRELWRAPVHMVLELAGLALVLVLVSHLLTGAPGTLLGAALAVAWLAAAARFIERRPIPATGLVRERAVRDLALGLSGGAALISMVVLVMAAAGWYRVESVDAQGVVVLAVPFIALFGAAVLEEILARAIVFRSLERAFGSWFALSASAAAFGALHLANPSASAIGAVVIALTAGVILAGLYMLTRSLWPVIGVHWAWNLFEGPVFGLPISGHPQQARLLHGVVDGPDAWTGGAFGLEASVITAVIGFAAGAAIVAFAVRRRQVRAPSWRARA